MARGARHGAAALMVLAAAALGALAALTVASAAAGARSTPRRHAYVFVCRRTKHGRSCIRRTVPRRARAKRTAAHRSSAVTTRAGTTPRSVSLPAPTTSTPAPSGAPPAVTTTTSSPLPPTTSRATTTAAPAPSRLQVSAREFTLTLSHPQIAGGAAVVEFVDAGQDPHDLHIRPADGGADVAAFEVSQPGTHVDQAITLPPGTYTLYCSLPGHEQAGMHATLTVG